MLHFICGRKGSGKTKYIIDSIAQSRKDGTILLVPETRSHSTERLLCRACGNSLSSFCEVTSFRRLATRIKSEAGGISVETVGTGRRILSLHAAVRSAAKVLRRMRPVALRPESLTGLLSAIDEFKSYGVSPSELMSASESVSGPLGDKLHDLSVIYSAYNESLGESSGDVYDELSYVSDILKNHGFFRGKTVYLDSFTGFTAAEFDIIENAVSLADDVYIALTLPENCRKGSENGIFDKTLDTMARISERASSRGAEISKTFLHQKCGSPALTYLEKALFSDAPEPFEGDAPITVARAPDAFSECELAAAYILDRLRLDGARLRDFTIAVSDEPSYLPVAEQVFSRYGIPTYISEKTPITDKPAVSLIRAALDCAVRGFRTDAVTNYIKTGFSGICSKTLDVFENYLYTHAPKGRDFASDFKKNPLGLIAEETDETHELLRIINRARRKVYEPLKTLSDNLRAKKTAVLCADALLEFTDEIHLARRCDACAYLAEQGGRLREAQEYRRLYEILTDAIETIGKTLGDTPVSPAELLSLFELVVSQYELDTIPTSLDRVSIFGLSRADGERNKYMIILGACEGRFPPADGGSGLLSDSDRRELSDLGIDLAPTSDERIFEAYREIHSVINGAETALYISSPSSGRNGEEISEASSVSRIRKLFSSCPEPLSLIEARLRAPLPCFDESVSFGFADELWKDDAYFSERLALIGKERADARGPIKKQENIERIFGKRISMSASRADLFSSCRFSYFMKYGLKIRTRDRAEVTPILIGNLMHYVIEHAVKKMSEDKNFDEKRAEELSALFCDEYISLVVKEAGELDAHTEFLLSRLKRAVISAVRDICREISKGQFVPTDFELKFSEDGDLPPVSVKGGKRDVIFRGAIDRVDLFHHDGKLYFRVVDYKSGKREFSLDDAVNGIGMQMLLYMFALEDMGAERYGDSPVGAGVMYVPIAPDASSERETRRSHTREGVILGDNDIIDAMESGDEKEYLPVSFVRQKDDGGNDAAKNRVISEKSSVLYKKQFEAVKKRLAEILRNIGDELSDGLISPNPYARTQKTSCDWCSYKSICAFDPLHGDDCFRNPVEIKSEDIINSRGGEENE